jgi:hypothetical protein
MGLQRLASVKKTAPLLTGISGYQVISLRHIWFTRAGTPIIPYLSPANGIVFRSELG